ncbi:MAG: tRNA guanosine(34) transglycosylase Tgt [Waddliaceae bacterium]
MKFTILKTDTESQARAGKIETAHGILDTPIFMPVGTRGVVKTLTPQHLLDIGTQAILSNTYHLMLRPGMAIMDKAGGLHRFMHWPYPILTDSGGFQIFSLSGLNRVTEKGVYFQSHLDGSRNFLGPHESMHMQKILGADIVMAFDECSPYPCERSQIEKAMDRTYHWERLCRDADLQPHQTLFGIAQGGMYEDLRRQSTESIVGLDFDGYAIGGLSVGEPADTMYAMLDASIPLLPKDKPRYLMGVGTPRNIIEAVMRGVDMFDCVLPTRNARNGTAYTWAGKIPIKAGRYAEDFTPLDRELNCYASQFSKAYLHHLVNVKEITGLTLLSLQSVAFYLDFMRQLRQAVLQGALDTFYERICAIYP